MSLLLCLVRGLLVRCPCCGASFMRRFRLLPSCARCGLLLDRGRGAGNAGIGALTVNIGLGEGAVLVLVSGWIAATMPRPPWEIIQYATLVAALVLPVLFYPTSQTLWLAIDLCMEPLRPGESQVPPAS